MIHTMQSRIAFFAGMLLVAACQPTAEDAVVQQWETYDLPLTATGTYENPYVDVEAWAVFTHEASGDTLLRPAFWDGGQQWRVRAALPLLGAWRWQTFSAPADAGLQVQGRLDVQPYTGSHPLIRHGLLRMSPGGRNVMHADGTPFLLVGDTPWALPFRATTGMATTYARDRQAKGFNAALLMTVQPDQDARGSRERGQTGAFDVGFEDLAEGHLNQLNVAYFQYFDSLVAILVDHGIVPVYQPVFHGFGWKGLRVLGPTADPVEYRRYQRYLIARYGASPAFWLVSGDAHGKDPGVAPAGEETERWDAYAQPTGIHYNPFDDYQPDFMPTDRCFHQNAAYQDAAWLDFQWCQTGHDGKHLYHKVARMYDQRPVKAVANGEPTYEGIHDPENGADWWQGEEAWMQLMYGGTMGVVYGAGAIWQWKYSGDEPGWDTWCNSLVSWEEALTLPGSQYPGRLRQALADYDWLDIEKHPELAEGALCLAHPGALYVLFLPAGGTRTLTGLSDALPYRWFDPVAGTWHVGGVTEGRAFSMQAPSEAPWVLVVGQPRQLAAG
ncbi:MAG: DUF4038 domain-containing protein [Bacteroidia bacterium]